MASEVINELNVLLSPSMAHGHMIPLLEMAKLRVGIFKTTNNYRILGFRNTGGTVVALPHQHEHSTHA
jgi:hypothetical protein